MPTVNIGQRTSTRAIGVFVDGNHGETERPTETAVWRMQVVLQDARRGTAG